MQEMYIDLANESNITEYDIYDSVYLYTGEHIQIPYGSPSMRASSSAGSDMHYENETYKIVTEVHNDLGTEYCIEIENKETDENIEIINVMRQNEYGTNQHYNLINYKGYDYEVESISENNYPRESIRSYEVSYKINTIKTTPKGHEYEDTDRITEEYDNVNEVFNILYK